MKQLIQEQHASTDLICLYIFLTFQGIFLSIGFYGFMNGNPEKFLKPYDADHHQCGIDLQGYDYIYFATPQQNFLYRTVCVQECPQEQYIQHLNCSTNSYVKSCNVNPSVNNISQSLLTYQSIQYHQICIPKNIEYFNSINQLIRPQSYDLINQGILDYILCIIGIPVISIFLSLILLLFLEKRCSFIIKAQLILSVLFEIIILILCILQYIKTKYNVLEHDKELTEEQLINYMESYWISEQLYLAIIIILAIFLIIQIGFSFSIKNKIDIISQFIKVGGDFIKSNISIILIPALACIILICYTILTLILILYIFSSFKAENGQTPYYQTTFNVIYQIFVCVYLFVYFWSVQFIIQSSNFVISYYVYQWYHEQSNKKINQNSFSIYSIFRYHIGSIVFGSILIPIIKLPKEFLEISKIQKNLYVRMFLLFSNNCYTIMHSKPNHFLECSITLRELILKEFETYQKIGELGQSFISVMQIFISFVCSLLCYVICLEHPYSIILSIIVFYISYSIIDLFASIYGQSSESVYILYLFNKYNDPQDQPQCTANLQTLLFSVQKEEECY